MESSLEITSTQNPRIKRIAKLAHRSTRDELGLTTVEGVREVKLALDSGVVPVEAYVCVDMDLAQNTNSSAVLQRLLALARSGQTELIQVTSTVFDKIAYRGESGGLLLVVPYAERTLDSLELSDSPLLIIVEDAEKPGNLGAILRTADAADVDALIVPTPTTADAERGKGTDLHNPNVIRASLGAVFTVPQVVVPAEELRGWLRTNGIRLVAAVPDAEVLYTDLDMTGPTAVIMGSEAWGLSDAWRKAADELVRIPMNGAVDSLNLATSTALLVYEAVRQRHLTR